MNAYAAGQEEMLRELSNAIKMATTDEAIQLLYAFGEGAHENGFSNRTTGCPRVVQQIQGRLMFYAKWRGWCAECGDEWEEGDEIGYVEDELCCSDCCESSDWDL